MSYKTYTLGNNSVINWRRSIDQYYKKGLPAFDDARTIRIQLNMVNDWHSKDQAFISAVKSSIEESADTLEYIEAFAEERVCMVEIKEELEAWLKERGLVN